MACQILKMNFINDFQRPLSCYFACLLLRNAPIPCQIKGISRSHVPLIINTLMMLPKPHVACLIHEVPWCCLNVKGLVPPDWQNQLT